MLTDEPGDTTTIVGPRHPPCPSLTLPCPLPTFHATIALAVEGMPPGWTARVLFLRRVDGSVEPMTSLVQYMREHPRRSRAWQDTVARALGLFWDFCRARGASCMGGAALQNVGERRTLFRAFALALVEGIGHDVSDDVLKWPRTSLKRARVLLRSIEDFAGWHATRTGDEALSPPPLPADALGVADLVAWARVRNVSMLAHLSAPEQVRRTAVADLGDDPAGPSAEPVKFFPPAHAERLLWEGHRRPGREEDPNPFRRYNLRDQMIALLDGWGGLRRSEGLHLWVQDVVENPERPGHALVVLHHPAEARVEYIDPVTRMAAEGSRQDVLDRVYRLRPRNLVTRGRYQAGWKGMDMDKSGTALVHWLDDRAGALFWVLYLGYLREVRGPTMAKRRADTGRDHPFLFVSEGGEPSGASSARPGDPYSPQAYERAHRAAVLRLKLPHGKRHGTTTHGLRHLYGQTLVGLGVPAQVIRKGLHHRSYLSQAVYTVPTRQRIDETLRRAWHRIETGEALPLAPLGCETTQALGRLNDTITGGGPLA